MFEISYANMMMLLATIPQYISEDDDYEYEGSENEFVNFFTQSLN